MNFLDYDAIPAANMSKLLKLLKSPKHYKHGLTHADKDKECFKPGRALHTALFEPLRFMADYVLSPFDDYRTKKAQAWRDEQGQTGKTILTETQFLCAQAMAKAVNANRAAMRYLTGGEAEQAATWTDPRTGILLKGRFDYVGAALADLKSTRNITPYEFGRDCAKYHYHTRMSFYRDGLRIATGKHLPVVIVAVENVAPFDVAVFKMSETDLERGREVYERLLDTLRICQDSNSWPGVSDEELDLKLPAWVDQTEEEEPITIGGNPIF